MWRQHFLDAWEIYFYEHMHKVGVKFHFIINSLVFDVEYVLLWFSVTQLTSTMSRHSMHCKIHWRHEWATALVTTADIPFGY
jgi:hypothetical protein